jgi:hypothetical protein
VVEVYATWTFSLFESWFDGGTSNPPDTRHRSECHHFGEMASYRHASPAEKGSWPVTTRRHSVGDV